MTQRIVIRDALMLPTAADDEVARADVLIVGRRIKSVAPAGTLDTVGARVIEGADRLLTPGLVNAHTHSPTNVLKGTGDRLSHPAFMWRNQVDTLGRGAAEIRLSALVGCIEHLLGGVTAIIDHFPEQGFVDADVDAVAGAYEMAGLRALVALRIYDGDYSDIEPPGGLGGEDRADNPLAPRPARESLALVERAIDRHHGRADGRITVCPAPSNPMRCSDALLADVAAMAKRRDTAIHMHLLETQAQARIAQARYGRSMIAQLDALGVLNDRLSTAHTVWLDQSDIERMAARGAIPVHNPASNLKLGVGLSPIATMLRAGVEVALGTDGASTNDRLDMYEAMRLALMLQRPSEPDRRRWPGAADAARMATIAGGKAMRCAGLGRIEPGAPADLVLHNLQAPGWIPLNRPLEQWVYSGSAASVDLVMVDGRVLVEDGRIVAFDVAPILAEARTMMHRQRARANAQSRFAMRMESLSP